jgi:hypothetical protein
MNKQLNRLTFFFLGGLILVALVGTSVFDVTANQTNSPAFDSTSTSGLPATDPVDTMATVTHPPSPTSTAIICTTWDLANDFTLSPDQNPNRDSCNNSNVWEFKGSPDLTRDPANYYTLSNFDPASSGYPGLNFWSGTYYDPSSGGYFPAIGFNASGATRILLGHITIPVNTVDVHPGPSQLGVIAWHSPLNGYVSITGGVADNDPACGDGIVWYVDKNATALASGSYANGGSQTFVSGTGGANLNAVAVSTSDVIYLAIGPNTSHICDNGRVDFTINVTTAPPAPTTVTPTRTPTATATLTRTPTNTSTATPDFSYNRPTAVSYAEQWAHYRNGNYPLAGEKGCHCNDCTNYISQVLHEGGFPLRMGNNNNDVTKWWYDPLHLSDYSKTWTVTDWLKNYMELYTTEYNINSTLSALEMGDIILLDLTGPENKPDFIADHGRVVVGYGMTSTNQLDYTNYGFLCIKYNEDIPPSTNSLLINQHCVDRQHVKWDYNLPQNANKWYVHVMK